MMTLLMTGYSFPLINVTLAVTTSKHYSQTVRVVARIFRPSLNFIKYRELTLPD